MNLFFLKMVLANMKIEAAKMDFIIVEQKASKPKWLLE